LELADCLYSVLVLADRYGVDLDAEFTRMTDGLDAKLSTQPEKRKVDGSIQSLPTASHQPKPQPELWFAA
jgi:hypothetical protein